MCDYKVSFVLSFRRIFKSDINGMYLLKYNRNKSSAKMGPKKEKKRRRMIKKEEEQW